MMSQKIRAKTIKGLVHQGSQLPVDGFATFIDYSMSIFGNDIRGMMWGSTNVLLGIDPNQVLSVGLATPFSRSSKGKFYIDDDWLPYLNDPSKNTAQSTHSERGDWHPEYFDGTANQAYHFWYYVSTTFFDSEDVSVVANVFHDPYFLECVLGEDLEKLSEIPILKLFHNIAPQTSKEDYHLGLKGIELGTDLWWADRIYPEGNYNTTMFPGADPGTWIRSHLGE